MIAFVWYSTQDLGNGKHEIIANFSCHETTEDARQFQQELLDTKLELTSLGQHESVINGKFYDLVERRY